MLMVVSVVIAEGKRPVSFRTRKLSPPAPMVLHSGGCGRVGHRRTQRETVGPPRDRGGPTAISGPFIEEVLHDLGKTGRLLLGRVMATVVEDGLGDVVGGQAHRRGHSGAGVEGAA